MTTRLAGSLALEPRDESLNGEFLGQSARVTATVGRSRCSNWRSRRRWLGRGVPDRRSRGSLRRNLRRSGGCGRGRRSAAGASAEHRRTRDVVLDSCGVRVEDDTILVDLVQGGTNHTFRLGFSGAGDLDVQALGVALGAVGGTSGVQSNDLVAEDVFARSEVGGDGDRPGVVLLDHLDGSPLAIGETICLNLGPLEVLLLNRRNVACVGSNVGDDGSNVGLWPVTPVELDSATCSDLGQGVVGALGASLLVADDV
jgi:hypothetical protein